MCVSEVSVDVPQTASYLARSRVHDRPVALQRFWVPFGGCRPGACAFMLPSLLLPCRTCFTACAGCPVCSSAWLPGWLCLSLMGVIGGSRLSSYLVDAAMQVGCGEAAWAGWSPRGSAPFSGFLSQGCFAWGLPVLVTAPDCVLHSQADLGGGCAAGRRLCTTVSFVYLHSYTFLLYL